MAINKETNRFYKNRMEIKKISEREHKDVGVASSMLASEKKWTNYEAEMNDWMELCRKYQQDSNLTLADLFK